MKRALRAARTDGYRLLEKERAEAVRQKEEKLRVYRDEVSREVATEVEATRKQEELAKGELDAQAGVMSELISSRILRRPAQ